MPWRVRVLWCYLSIPCLTQCYCPLFSYSSAVSLLPCLHSLSSLASLETQLHFHPQLFPYPIRLPNIHSWPVFLILSLLPRFSIHSSNLHWHSFLAKPESSFQFRLPLMQSSGPLSRCHIFFLSTLSFGERVLCFLLLPQRLFSSAPPLVDPPTPSPLSVGTLQTFTLSPPPFILMVSIWTSSFSPTVCYLQLCFSFWCAFLPLTYFLWCYLAHVKLSSDETL